MNGFVEVFLPVGLAFLLGSAIAYGFANIPSSYDDCRKAGGNPYVGNIACYMAHEDPIKPNEKTSNIRSNNKP